MTTGDLKNNLRKFQAELKLVGYGRELDVEGLSIGKPSAVLPILHYVLTESSIDLAEYFCCKGYEVFGKSDLKFIQVVYRILRDEFSTKAPLTREQFFSLGFTERKLQFVTSVMQLCRRKSEAMRPRKKKTLTSLGTRGKVQTQRELSNCRGSTPASGERKSKEVTMDTRNSEKPHQASVVTSKGNRVIDVKGATTSSVRVGKTSQSAPTYVKTSCDSTNMKYLSNHPSRSCSVFSVEPLTDRNTENQSASILSAGVLDEREHIPTRLDHPLFAAKENISPEIYCEETAKKLDGFRLRFAPIPGTYPKLDKEFQTRNQLSRDDGYTVRKGAVKLHGRNNLLDEIMDWDEDKEMTLGGDVTEDVQEFTTEQESPAIIEYLQKQQERIEKLEQDSQEKSVLLQDLLRKNSELSARILVLETSVKLLEERE